MGDLGLVPGGIWKGRNLTRGLGGILTVWIGRDLGELELHPRAVWIRKGLEQLGTCAMDHVQEHSGAVVTLSHGGCGAGMGTGRLWVYPMGCADQEGSGRPL